MAQAGRKRIEILPRTGQVVVRNSKTGWFEPHRPRDTSQGPLILGPKARPAERR